MNTDAPTAAVSITSGGRDRQMTPGQKLEIRVYTSLESLSGLRAEWESLLDVYPYSTTFSTWEWLAPWWRAFGGADSLLVLAAYDGDSMVGFAPLSITAQEWLGSQLRVLRLWGDGTHDSDDLDMPVRPGCEDRFAQAILLYMEEHRSDWDICQLRTLPPQSLIGNRILDHLKRKEWRPYLSTRPQSVVTLPETWDQYAKSLSAKERGKIGIRFRKLEKKYKLEIRKCSNDAELDEYLQALSEVHRRHWQQRGLPGTLHVAARQKFYRELGSLLLRRGRLELWILRLDDKIVAAQFGMRHGNTVFSLQEGFDPEYSSDSVGYVLRSQVLKTLIDEGVRTYDFLGGTDESKLRWGAKLNYYQNIEFARRRTKGSVYLLLKYKSADARAWLRTRLPKPVLQSFKRISGRHSE